MPRLRADKPASPPPEQRAYTYDQAAAVLGVCDATVRRAVKAGRLRSITLGRSRRIPVEAIDELLASRSG